MAQKSNIGWTEITWNPTTGCTKVSEGCRFCYAENINCRFGKGRKFTDVLCHADRLEQPFAWRKPRLVFVNSMSDLWHKDVPADFIDKVFSVMAQTPQHTYMILTKRPERMYDYTKANNYVPLPNVWLGISAEDNYEYMYRGSILKQTPAVLRFVSLEPMLKPIPLNITVTPKLTPGMPQKLRAHDFDWFIVGCESGHKRRPFHNIWIDEIIKYCKEMNNIKLFVKQIRTEQDKVISDMNLFPEKYRIQEIPDRQHYTYENYKAKEEHKRLSTPHTRPGKPYYYGPDEQLNTISPKFLDMIDPTKSIYEPPKRKGDFIKVEYSAEIHNDKPIPETAKQMFRDFEDIRNGTYEPKQETNKQDIKRHIKHNIAKETWDRRQIR